MEKIKLLFILTHCTKSGPIQQMLNLISNIDKSTFEAQLITIYPEDPEKSILNEYKKVIKHRLIPLSKLDIFFHKTKAIRSFLIDYQPDVIHSFGVFPDYLIAAIRFKNHVLTSRNYVYDDYIDQYGIIRGLILSKIHLKAIKNTQYACCCSESLHNLYINKMKLDMPYIQNGIDTSTFSVPTWDEKRVLRQKLNLPQDKQIFIYGAVFNKRKNQSFLLKCVSNAKLSNSNCFFLLLGDGPAYMRLKEKYSEYDNIAMPGNVKNMADYLRAANYYISTSVSEGLPNGVLEAMGCGLPVVLSDIEQHLEILKAESGCGFAYSSGDESDFVSQINNILSRDWEEMSKKALLCVEKHFSATIMSREYQKLYQRIVSEGSNE